ncbi:MAG: glycosyltransferase [Myxococcales bacterium]|nr:glycosyltransferase [Myxococcales bacterium]
MKLALHTWGTEGDIRPFFALAAALVARGHQVRVAYACVDGADLGALARAAGVADEPIAAAYYRDHHATILAHARANFRRRNALTQLRVILEDTLDPVAEQIAAAADELVRWADASVVHVMDHPAVTAATLAGQAYACVAFAPMFETRRMPPIGAPHLGAWGNRALWGLARRVMDRMIAPRVNAVRAARGAPPVTDVTRRLVAEARLVLVAMSPALLPRPDDWPAAIAVSGELALPATAEPVPPALADFVAAGPPPVFFTLGSMAALDPERAGATAAATIAACAEVEARCVIQAPPGVALPAAAHALVIARAPHAAVFPRAAAVIHHGGAGTSHAALRAGRPSIVIPHAVDQYYWADELYRHGVAARPLRARQVSIRRLARRLRTVLGDPAIAARAEALGQAARVEDGAATAAARLEAAFGPAAGPPATS